MPPNWQHEISGEFTLARNGQLSLRLRLNGQIIFWSAVSNVAGQGSRISAKVSDLSGMVSDMAGDLDETDQLIDQGALSIVENTQPYFVAAYLYDKGDLGGPAPFWIGSSRCFLRKIKMSFMRTS